MARWIRLALGAALAFGVAAGCSSPPSPYRSVANWAIRQNAVPSYFAAYDVLFIYPYVLCSADRGADAPSDRAAAAALHDCASFLTEEVFGRTARVFAPVVHRTAPARFAAAAASADGVEALRAAAAPSVRETVEAIRFYLKTYHEKGRPYVLLGHGQGAFCLYEALRRLDGEIAPEDGFVAAYLPDLPAAALRRLDEDFAKGDVRPARGPLDTGVVAAWRVADGTRRLEGGIHPLGWSRARPAPGAAAKGARFYDFAATNVLARKTVVAGFCRAGADGALHAETADGAARPLAGEGVSPFAGDIAENAGARVARHLAKRRWAGWASETDEPPVEAEEGAR